MVSVAFAPVSYPITFFPFILFLHLHSLSFSYLAFLINFPSSFPFILIFGTIGYIFHTPSSPLHLFSYRFFFLVLFIYTPFLFLRSYLSSSLFLTPFLYSINSCPLIPFSFLLLFSPSLRSLSFFSILFVFFLLPIRTQHFI